MSHLDYYRYQAEARGIRSLTDVVRAAHDKAYIYDQIVRPWLPDDTSKPVVELACGHGAFLQWLKERKFIQITGIDSSPEQVEFARQVGADVYETGAVEWLAGQKDHSQETLIAIDFIEHISKDDLMVLLSQASRVLVKGGQLILRYPNGDSPLVGMNLFNDITHVWTYTPNCLQSLGRMHGFSNVLFADESSAAIRDYRWLKVPLCKISQSILGFMLWGASREKVKYWSPHLWASLRK